MSITCEVFGGGIFVRNMPKLSGTEKQVAWAEDLRQRRMNQVTRLIEGAARAQDKATTELIDTEVKGLTMRRVIIALFSKTDAKFWIDTRNQIEQHLIQDIANELGA